MVRVMDDLLQEFLTETAENLEVIDTELVRFEADPEDAATLNNIFRLVHTIKGTCGFLGLPRLERVAHAGETLLGKFRDGVLAVTPDAVTLVLTAIDRIKEILIGLEATGAEPAGDDTALLDHLHAAAEGRFAAAAPQAAQTPAPPPVEAHPLGPNGERWDPDMQRYLRPGEVSLADLEAAFNNADGPVLAKPEPVIAAIVEKPAAKPVVAAREAADDEDDGARAKGGGETGAQTVRVSVDVLERLMTTVSELVLTRNQLLQMVRTLGDSEFKAPLQRLSNITAELQDRVMKTRMQPVGSAWRKLPRIVRDICRETGKKIDLRLEGEATELDRQVLELIKDPLTHMIRNSVDHGIEQPNKRLEANKPELGVIRLAAHHEGGHILIVVQDDGAGLNTTRIRQKAVEKGLVSASEALAMTDAQIHRFIFAPGFSTAQAVTNLSGRGVGMDVVKTNIEIIGGSIELSSVEGVGSTFRIKIPLTLAIVSALILGAGGQRFAAPQTSVLELVRVGGGSDHVIDRLNETPVLRLRERLLPLVELSGALNLAAGAATDAARYVVVMQVGAQQFGVVVDEVCDTEEIVVKPLASLLRGVPMLSGATILGDGSVVVILDPNGLAKAVGRVHDEKSSQTAAVGANASAADNVQGLILFRAGSETLKAVPLKLITRLEEVAADAIERADGRTVLQYRGALMPIIHAAGDYAFKAEGKQPILVFSRDNRAIGLAVDKIVDIVHEPVTIDLATDHSGVIGAAIIRGKATEIADISHYLGAATNDWRDRRGEKAKGTVLLIEQSEFARNMLKPLIEAAGYSVQIAPSFDQGLELHADRQKFDAVLADLETDPRAAATFAKHIAGDENWRDVARLGLGAGHGADGLFSECVPKTDRASLIAALEFVLKQKGFAA
jgi:two-component system chemotaxis sensor kinase CheA